MQRGEWRATGRGSLLSRVFHGAAAIGARLFAGDALERLRERRLRLIANPFRSIRHA
jgi:hypothetical protein